MGKAAIFQVINIWFSYRMVTVKNVLEKMSLTKCPWFFVPVMNCPQLFVLWKMSLRWNVPWKISLKAPPSNIFFAFTHSILLKFSEKVYLGSGNSQWKFQLEILSLPRVTSRLRVKCGCPYFPNFSAISNARKIGLVLKM